MKVWGLTGGIASGKSSAARILEDEGFPVLDADQVSRELSSPGGLAHAAILQRFGTDDRAKLRELIFADPLARADLEKILHPLIVAESRKRLQAFGKPVVFYEATLLVETGRHQEFDGLLVIEAPMAIRRERLIRRDHSPAPLAEKILRSQATDEQRRAVATAVLVNDGSLEDLREKVRHFIRTQNLK